MSIARALLVAMLAATGLGCRNRPDPAPAPSPAQPPASTPSRSSAENAASAPRDTARSSLTREYRGAYSSGFEMSWFEPCNPSPGDRMWWVTLTDEALSQRDSLLRSMTARAAKGLFVRWKGTAGPRMPAGQMGRGSRYLLVTEILEIRPLPDNGGCSGRDA